jgi:hypothetical protein
MAFDALTKKPSEIMVNLLSSMPSSLVEKFKRLFFPEGSSNTASRTDSPVRTLVVIHELLSRLANQIESHAVAAPYPHIAQVLHRVAAEKYAQAGKLKSIIEALGEKTRSPVAEPKSGKNHWERLNHDLHDQITVDDLLLELEIKAGENSGIAQIVQELGVSQKSHQRVLSDLIAIADPQATQT